MFLPGSDLTPYPVPPLIVSGGRYGFSGVKSNTFEEYTALYWSLYTVRATITNGATATTSYTQDFNITVVAPPTFTITMTNDGNGTATASPATTTAGTTVTITATPNSADYQFLHWVVVSGGVTLSSNAANPATFTMPSSNVEIRAEFELTPQAIILANEVARLHNNGNPHISVPGLVDGLPHTINTGLELSTGVTLVTAFLGDVYATVRPPNVIWADLFVGTANSMLVLAILATPIAESGDYVFNDVRLRHTASGLESAPFTLTIIVP